MLSARWGHGVIEVGDSVYIFGGVGKYHADGAVGRPSTTQRTCEKIDIRYREWTALPKMREGRCGFNPCELSRCIYLCGSTSLLIEAFSPSTDLFSPHQISLPEQSFCCLYTHNSLLVVHSENYISKFSARQAGQLLLFSQVKAQRRADKCSNCQPVLDSTRGCFFIADGSKCLCFEMETGAVVKSFA